MNITEHKITIENFHCLTIDDLRVLCPIIGDRLKLEDKVNSRKRSETDVCKTALRADFDSYDVATTKVRQLLCKIN